MQRCVLLITDGIDGITGPIRVAYALGKHLIGNRINVKIITPYINAEVNKSLIREGFNTRSLGKETLVGGQAGHLWIWIRNSLFMNRKIINEITNDSECISINLSFEVPIQSTIFYTQGYVGELLRDIAMEFPLHYRMAYKLSSPVIRMADNTYSKALLGSKYVIANSRYSAYMATERGAHVHGIIYPPIDTRLFRPVNNPSSDYVVTYVGKETQFDVLRAIANTGIRIIAFGSKVPWLPRWFLRHRNIDYRGRVSDEELVKLYANARFTVFPFTHEPFGYVPVESMACGTPVLTYNKQGPSETVIINETGWLVNTPEELVKLAERLWVSGYPETMRIKARERALLFDEDIIISKWLNLIMEIGGTLDKRNK
ncbi:MAG: glycosyltransferase [Vulcanisaeta sp.]